MRRIDSHVHLYPPEANRDPAAWAGARAEARWSAMATRRRRGGAPVQAFPELDQLLAAMDGAGVERAVLQGWYWEHPRSCSEQNRFYAQCLGRHPDRLAAFASFHPADGPAAVAAELERARGEGFAGLGELSPHSQGYGMDDPGLELALGLAAEWRWPVNLHVTDPEGRPYPGRVETPAADFLGLARRFPRTRLILAHWGGLLPLRHPEAAALPNLFYDTAASALTYDRSIWLRFAGAVGTGRILFGSDYPLNLYPAADPGPRMERLIAEAEGAGFSAPALEAIFSENYRRVAGG